MGMGARRERKGYNVPVLVLVLPSPPFHSLPPDACPSLRSPSDPFRAPSHQLAALPFHGKGGGGGGELKGCDVEVGREWRGLWICGRGG